MTRRNVLAGTLLAVTLMAPAIGCGGASSSGWPDASMVSAGDGGEVSSAEVVADGTTVVNLWATWCGPCKRELPMLEAMSTTGTRVIGVNIGDAPGAVDTFLADLGITFANYIDVDGELMAGLDIPSVPATLIVVDGDLAWQHLGEVTREDIDAELAVLAG